MKLLPKNFATSIGGSSDLAKQKEERAREMRKANGTHSEQPHKLCKSCRKIVLRYIDEVAPIDRQLAMLAEFCIASEYADFPIEVVVELGVTIRQFQERRIITNFYFFGSELVTLAVTNLTEDDAVVQGEIRRLEIQDRC